MPRSHFDTSVPSDDTGKSRVLGAIREAYEADGYRVTGMSWTNSVVQDMRQDGFAHASTIAAAMKRLEAGTRRKDVLIVDEAAMLATQHLAGVVGRAREAGAKVMTFLDGVEQRYRVNCVPIMERVLVAAGDTNVGSRPGSYASKDLLDFVGKRVTF